MTQSEGTENKRDSRVAGIRRILEAINRNRPTDIVLPA